MANKGARQSTWIDGPHGMVEVRRGEGTQFLVIDPITEQVIFTGSRTQANAFALGDTGTVREVVR